MPLNPASISVFLPAFNDEAAIGELVSEALILLKSLTNDYEVIVKPSLAGSFVFRFVT